MLTTTVPLRFTQRQGLKIARNLHRTIMTSSPLIPRQQKVEGDISAVFTSLRPSDHANVFPPRFAELKRTIWNDALVQSWKEVLEALEVETARIAEQGEKVGIQMNMDCLV